MFLCLLNCEYEVFEPDSLLSKVVVLTTVYGPVQRLGFRVGASGREHAVQAQEQHCVLGGSGGRSKWVKQWG